MSNAIAGSDRKECGQCRHYEEQGAFPMGVGKCHFDGSTTTEVDSCADWGAIQPPGAGLRMNGIARDSEGIYNLYFNRRLTDEEERKLYTGVKGLVGIIKGKES